MKIDKYDMIEGNMKRRFREREGEKERGRYADRQTDKEI